MIDRDELTDYIRRQPWCGNTSIAMSMTNALLAKYNLTLKPKPIEVGCKVKWRSTTKEFTAIAIHNGRAWIDNHYCEQSQRITTLANLTRID